VGYQKNRFNTSGILRLGVISSDPERANRFTWRAKGDVRSGW
jgi:hypothetical protein